MRIINMNFFNGNPGPNADTSGGFHQVDFNTGGSAFFDVAAPNRFGNGNCLKIVSDSRSFDSTSGKTVLEGYDNRSLSDITINNISTNGYLTAYPSRIRDGDSWWYSFSLYLPGTVWAKGALYEPTIWHMVPIQPGGTSTYSMKAPVSLAIDFPGTTANNIASWYTTTTTPHLYVNTLLPVITGTDTAFFNNILNYQHGDLGQLSFSTWYDIKFFVRWSSSNSGNIQAWIKPKATKSFATNATYTATNIQTVAKVSSVPVEGHMRVGFSAQLNGRSSANYMQNTLYLDNILAGNTMVDVNLYPQALDITGTISFDGGWDDAVMPGAVTDSAEIFASSWGTGFAAPNGIATIGIADAQYAINVVNDNVYNSPYAAKFEVRAGDSDGFYERAEVSGTVVPFAGATAGFSWSTFFDNSWNTVSPVSHYYWHMNDSAKGSAQCFGMYTGNGSVYLEINNFIGSTARAIIPWGTSITSFLGTWTNFKLQMKLGTATGSAALWINNVQQTMNYPLGIGNGNGGINTTAYTGPTIKSGSGIYPSMGIKRLPDFGTAILWHDNFKITS